ncbi:PAS domain-containing protein [Rhodobacteraceae bacterium 63075]|nr:PAS domain-containing protein [Rhodobacteraceae bacterium 63075]
MFTFVDFLAVLIAGSLAAAMALHFARHPRKAALAKSPEETPGEADRVRLRFEGQDCTRASAAALEALELDRASEVSWPHVRAAFGPRFQTVPTTLEEIYESRRSDDEAVEHVRASYPEDQASLEIRSRNDSCDIQIVEKTPLSTADRHRAFLHRAELGNTLSTIGKISHPIWTTTRDGEMIWSNRAYKRLEEDCRASDEHGSEAGPLFSFKIGNTLKGSETRVSITLGNAEKAVHWYDITSVEIDEDRIFHTAINVDNLISAETAQRNFVQTLAKTFAQLSTGLAIFARDRRLVLFNPALLDLTGLPAHFLSAQPTLQSFFDRLRDNRIMPEPKDYSSWRRQIADLVVKSADGRYQETWHLPNGLTYRIVGRPHPDGAIAILIEDISVEMSLTQRFRGQIELSNSVLDNMQDAVIAFDNGGAVLLWNKAFRNLVGLAEDASPTAHTATSILRLWQARVEIGVLRKLLSRQPSGKAEATGVFALKDGRSLRYSVRSHDGAANLVTLYTSELPDSSRGNEAAGLESTG